MPIAQRLDRVPHGLRSSTSYPVKVICPSASQICTSAIGTRLRSASAVVRRPVLHLEIDVVEIVLALIIALRTLAIIPRAIGALVMMSVEPTAAAMDMLLALCHAFTLVIGCGC